MKIEEYKKNPIFCLFCGGDNLKGETPRVDLAGNLTSMVTCVTCSRKWIEVYHIADVMLLDKK